MRTAIRRLRDYACECPRRSCRERIYLEPARFRELAPLGRVVIPAHAGGGKVVRRGPGFVVVAGAPR